MPGAADRQQKRRLDLLSRLPMGPRKKSKSDVKAPVVDTTTSHPESDTASSTNTLADVPVTSSSQNSDVDTQPSSLPTNKKSWYGSWNSKAAPVAQLSTSIAGSSSTPNLRANGSKLDLPTTPKRYMSGSMKRGSRANPLAASLSNVTATPSPTSSRSSLPLNIPPRASVSTIPGEVKHTEDPPLPPDPSTTRKEMGTETPKQDPKPQRATGVWRGWWSTPDKPQDPQEQKTESEMADASREEAKNTPLPGTTPADEIPEQMASLQNAAQPAGVSSVPGKDDKQQPEELSKKDEPSAQTKSWFWLWSQKQNQRDESTATDPRKPATDSEDNDTTRGTEGSLAASSPPRDVPAALNVATEEQPQKESPVKNAGWAFWSREKSKLDSSSDTESTHKQVGELAVSGTPSQSKPEEAQFNEREESAKTDQSKKNDKAKKDRRRSKDDSDIPSQATSSGNENSKVAQIPGRATETAQIVPSTQTQPTAKIERKNLLFPEFYATYKLAQQPTYWQQIRRYFLGSEASSPHLSVTPNPVRVKKALAIGIHGYFPAPLIQKVLGQPTGTSIRFANAAATAIKRWTNERGYEADIEKVALEGEGFVADRVETLWKLLLNWIDHIRSADFILVACHSQGVPVSIMLVAKLVQFGCVNPNVRIGICAMAGVNLGPFPEFRSRFIGGSALELFDFGRPDSKVSLMYQDALNVVLGRGVKVLYVGSIDDQLVSLESSTFSNISHPLIYRAVFIDTRTHAPNFLTHLIGFVLKLRNLGIPDHGLIRELSPALAGSLYTGEGHSQIYHDAAVYDLAVHHALETTDLSTIEGKMAGKLRPDGFVVKWDDVLSSPADRNPYFLPWAMRGVLEEEMVRRELGDECKILLEEFEEWKPTNKVLKDVKFRLEAVKSKL